mgnify:CR=1 FL=1
MDPALQLLASFGTPGVIAFVVWKLAHRALRVWKEVAASRATLETTRLTQQHETQKLLADSVGCLSDRVHENTQAAAQQLEAVHELVTETKSVGARIERLIASVEYNATPPDGVRAVRRG